MNWRLGLGLVLLVAALFSGWSAWKPVSYTHLDVYKRQGSFSVKTEVNPSGFN